MSGSIEKRTPYRNRQILEFPKKHGCPCMRCSIQDVTIEACHYQGPRALILGKGKGQKPDDDCVAFLCRNCHEIMDAYLNGEDRWERSEEFLFLVVKTMNLLHRIGFEF